MGIQENSTEWFFPIGAWFVSRFVRTFFRIGAADMLVALPSRPVRARVPFSVLSSFPSAFCHSLARPFCARFCALLLCSFFGWWLSAFPGLFPFAFAVLLRFPCRPYPLVSRSRRFSRWTSWGSFVICRCLALVVRPALRPCGCPCHAFPFTVVVWWIDALCLRSSPCRLRGCAALELADRLVCCGLFGGFLFMVSLPFRLSDLLPQLLTLSSRYCGDGHPGSSFVTLCVPSLLCVLVCIGAFGPLAGDVSGLSPRQASWFPGFDRRFRSSLALPLLCSLAAPALFFRGRLSSFPLCFAFPAPMCLRF